MRTIERRGRLERRGGLAVGCLITLGVLFVLIAIAVVFVAMKWRGWAASMAQTATREVLRTSSLPDDQKQAITAEIDALAKDFEDGKVSLGEMQQVFQEVAESPLLPLAGVQVAKEKYIDTSTMTSEEKASAERSLQRFARGIHEGKITPAEEQITDAIKPIVRLKPGNQWELKENPTRQEIDQFIANAKAKADEAQIPDEPFAIDFAAEIKKIIAEARGAPTPAAPAPVPAPAPAPAPPPGG